MDRLTLVGWGQEWEQVYPGVRRWSASGERMTLTIYEFEEGARFPCHQHDQEQFVLVSRGTLTFTAGTHEATVSPGKALIIPPMLPHEAVAGNEGALVTSVVAPARRSSTDVTMLNEPRARDEV